MWPRRICVVGGGTAGWLAAMMLGDSAKRGGHACDITVIESSKIGTIGVGEGTTAVFRQMLKHFGLDEMEFLRELYGELEDEEIKEQVMFAVAQNDDEYECLDWLIEIAKDKDESMELRGRAAETFVTLFPSAS